MIEVMEDGVARRSAAHPVTGTRPRRWVYLNTVVAVALPTPPGIFPVVLPQSRRTASRDSSLVSSWHWVILASSSFSVRRVPFSAHSLEASSSCRSQSLLKCLTLPAKLDRWKKKRLGRDVGSQTRPGVIVASPPRLNHSPTEGCSLNQVCC